MYTAALRNGFYLPKLKDSFVTMQLLRDLKDGNIILPKSDEIRFKNCPTPPPKAVVAAEIQKTLISSFPHNPSSQKLADLIVKKPPSSTYCLALLSTLKPDHNFFDRQFVYEPKRSVPIEDDENYVRDPNGFFENLPPIKGKRRNKRQTKIDVVSKNQRDQKLLSRLEARRQIVMNRIAEHEAKERKNQEEEKD